MLNKIVFSVLILLGAAANAATPKYVGTASLEEHLGPSHDAKVTNKIYKNQKLEIYEDKAGWSRVSEYYDGEVEGVNGKVARWVESAALVDSRMEDNQISPSYSDPRIEEGAIPKVGQHELSESDIRTLYAGAIKFLNNGRCSKIEYADKSVDKPGVYYVNCGDENVFFTSQDVAGTVFSEAPKQNNNTDNPSGHPKGKKEFKYLMGLNSSEAIADPRIIKQLKKIVSNKALDALTYQANDEPVATDGRFYIIRTDSGGGNCANCGESLIIADGEDGTFTVIFYGDNGLVYKGNKANVGEIHFHI